MKSGKLLKAAGILLVIFAALSVAAAFYGVFKLNSDVNGAVGSKQSYETAIKDYSELTASLADGREGYEEAMETISQNQTSYEIGREQYSAEKAAYDAAEADYNAALASSQNEDMEKAERLKAELDMQKGRLDALKDSLSVYEDATAIAEKYEAQEAALSKAEDVLRSDAEISAALDSGADIRTVFADSINAKSAGYSVSLYLYVALCFGAVFAALAASLGLSLLPRFGRRKKLAAQVLSAVSLLISAAILIYCAAAGVLSSLCLITNAVVLAIISAVFLIACILYPSRVQE